MANTTALKRGWHWDSANSTLDLYVNGTEIATFSTTTTTLTGILNIGSSASPKSYTAGTPAVAWYFTSANTSSTNSEPFYVKSVMTGAAGYGGRCRFHSYTNAALTTNFMALKAYAEFGDSGSVTGLAAGLCAEMVTPNADLGGGNFYPLELEYVAGGTSTASAANAGRVGWMYMNNTGDADGDFDDNGVLFDIEGLTAGSGHLWDTTANAATGDNTIKIKVNGTIKYLLVADDAS